jgi:hypothetical protein
MAKHGMMKGINLLGLGEFGLSGLNPAYGAAIGGGIAWAGGMLFARNATTAPNASAYSLGVGLAASAAMLASSKTKHLAMGSAIGVLLVSGLRLLEQKMFEKAALKGAFGMPQIHALNGLGMPQIQALNGFGIPQVFDVPQAQGTIPGVAGAFAGTHFGDGSPVSLLGMGSPQADQVSLLGGPAIHGLSAAYGATLLGGGRG